MFGSALVADPGFRWLAQALQQIREAACVTDAAQLIRFANEAFIQMHGYQQGELYGKPIACVCKVSQTETLANHLSADEGWHGFGTGRSKQGDEFPISVSATRLLSGSMENTGFLWMVHGGNDSRQGKEWQPQSEQGYRAFIRQSTECIWRLEFERPIPITLPEDEQIEHFFRHGYIAECNDVMAQMYGLTQAAEMVGMRLGALLVRSDSLNTEHLRRFIRSGYRLVNEETHEIDQSGQSKFFSNNIVGIVENGFLLRNWGTQRDISELRCTERALHLANEILNTITAFVLVADSTGQITYASPSLSALGYDPKELLGSGWWHMTRPDEEERDRVVRIITDTARGKVPVSCTPYETKVRHKDGSVRCILWQDSAKIPGFVIGVGQDITEWRATQEALANSEARLRKLVDSNIVGVFFADFDGPILDANDAFLSLIGYNRDDLRSGKLRWDLLTPAESIHSTRLAVEQTRTRGVCVPFEKEYLRKDGTRVPVLLGAALLPGSATECVCIVVDLSQQKRTEQERQILYEQLVQSHKMEAVGQLAGGIAHDFNNLLNVISGYTELMIAKLAADDPVQSNANKVLGAVRSAAGLVAQLLAFSRKQTFRTSALNLNSVISVVMGMLPRLIREDIQLIFSPAPDLHVVNIDQCQIEQVIINLAINARDAMPSGGVLRIETKNATISEPPTIAGALASGQYACLTISDTGIGMDKDTMSRIFEPFFTTKRVGEGTGLGLATVYGTVKQSGGEIVVDSQPGMGSSFKIYLPSISCRRNTATAEKADTEVRGGNETILLVEDQEALRTATKEYLEGLGYRVLAAQHGEDALQVSAAHAGNIHLLITDLVMPKLNGLSAREQLIKARPRLKTIFMSGYAEELHCKTVAEMNIPLVQKPFMLSRLGVQIREVLIEGNSDG